VLQIEVQVQGDVAREDELGAWLQVEHAYVIVRQIGRGVRVDAGQ